MLYQWKNIFNNILFFCKNNIKFRDEDSNIHWLALHFYGGLTGILETPLESFFVDMIPNSVNHNVLYLLFESQNPEYVSRILKGNQYPVQIHSKLQGYITGYCMSHCSSTAEWEIDDWNNDLLQSMITGTSSGMGGMITSLVISNVTDYSKCLQMLYKLEHYTKKLFYLSLESFYCSYLSFSSSSPFFYHHSCDNDCICCDQLSQLYRYCPTLQIFILSINGSKLNCTPMFSSLHLMTCLVALDVKGIVIDDSNHEVSTGLRQTTTLNSLSLSDCELINLSSEGLSQNKSIVSLNLRNMKMNIEGAKVLKEILSKNVILERLVNFTVLQTRSILILLILLKSYLKVYKRVRV